MGLCFLLIVLAVVELGLLILDFEVGVVHGYVVLELESCPSRWPCQRGSGFSEVSATVNMPLLFPIKITNMIVSVPAPRCNLFVFNVREMSCFCALFPKHYIPQ